ncbi:hypothetical protein SAMN02746065_10436 [Desulfocicer vacuolatum DSM 3385]|uniref:Iron transporter n=1 Tax=Desulfocicer vacuolatum DSM 3385 TaxID=1121400 RepID=A0A1W2A248_9BACT|nr:iron transporter [Desulfocicer vacuolatum]SMC54799.1 hypothetical protein SAMN02746065_10436 [Desulfocicer vacuolatum DSM 3385]
MRQKIMDSIKNGLKRGMSGYLWLLKILVPISLGTALLVYSGWLYSLDFLIQPAMGLLHLPASAALPLIIGLFTGIYGAIGAMAALPLTLDQMTLIAIFLLISHNIIQESIVQGQSGFNPVAAACFRLIMSILVTVIAAFFMDVAPPGMPGATAAQNTAAVSLGSMLSGWTWDMAGLGLQIFLIIMPLMVVMELMKTFHLIQHLVKAISPILSLMGLGRSTGVLWLTAAIFGLTYGAAVIVEETRENTFDRDDLNRLHLSIGINHAMIEDPALFLPLGIFPFWLWVPRLVAAIMAIYLLHIVNFIRKFHAQRTGHKKFCNH